MIAAANNAGFTHVFSVYLRWLLRRSFRSIWIARGSALPAGGFIAAANHTSWWDGFVPFMVQRVLQPRTPFALMMDEAQLRRFPFFRLGGAFSIGGSARKARESILYAADRARSGAGVWIFPQGCITPPNEPLHFTGGYLHAARWAAVPVVPVALRFAMLEAQRPDVFFAVGDPVAANAPDAGMRVPAGIRAQLDAIDRAIFRGTAQEICEPLFSPATGVDDAIARLTRSMVRH